MKANSTLSRLRRKADLLYREYRAIMILTNNLTGTERERIDRNIVVLQGLPLRKIRSLLPEVEQSVQEASSHFGLKGSLEEMESILRPLPDEPQDPPVTYRFVVKSALQQLFSHYEQAMPPFQDLPPHARIAIEVAGLREDKGKATYFILEAAVFGDMAELWNATLEISQPSDLTDEAMTAKRMYALSRATAKAAFNLLEAYLNGIAIDIIGNQKLTAKQLELLTEWDARHSRPKRLSLRDKLLQYPKIALGVQHPPLSESNCPQMARLLDTEQRLRHALIHPTPRDDPRQPTAFREDIYLNLTNDEVAELCDDTVELIHTLCNKIQARFGNVDLWLHRRDDTGRFPAQAFT